MQTHRRTSLLVSVLVVGLSASAAAERTTRHPTYSARHAAQQVIQRETGKLARGSRLHAHTTHYLGYSSPGSDRTQWKNERDPRVDFHKVVIWQGRERGPANLANAKGPYGVRLAIVPADRQAKLTPAGLVAATRLSRDLTKAGEQKVARHLRAKGLAPKTIQLGDFMPAAKNPWDQHLRLSQKPISRENGFLRYTVTFADGSKGRYEVETIARNLAGARISAKNSAKVPAAKLLGAVFADKDSYR